MSSRKQTLFSHDFRDANFFSRLFFFYVHPIFRKCQGNNQTLEDHHLIDMSISEGETQAKFEEFSALYRQIKQNSARKEKDVLMATILGSFKWEVVLICSLSFLGDGLALFFSYYLKYIILFLKDEEAEVGEGVWKAVVFVLSLIFSSILRNQVYYKCVRTSLALKKLIILLIYNKISNMRAYDLQDSIISKQISLMSSEFVLIERQSYNLPVMFTLPLLNLGVISLVYYEMGWQGALTVLAGSLCLIIVALISKRSALKINLSFGKLSDRILITLRNILTGIKVLKCYCLENHYISKLQLNRKSYSKFVIVNNLLLMQGDIYLTYFGVLTMIPIIALLNNENGYLENFQVMGIYSLVVILFRQINYVFLFGTMIMVRFSSAIIRLSEIMQLEDTFQDQEKETEGEAPIISIQDGTFSWSGKSKDKQFMTTELRSLDQPDSVDFSLQRINFEIQKGLIVVIGKIGSGKSSLLNVLMKETIQLQGQMKVSGSIAYVEQSPYLITGTIKENVLLGEEYDEERFQTAIKYSCLKQDINSFPLKEETLIGDRGQTLSGGQKARVSLARALYSNSDIYLLDDPLSAVDPKVAAKIFGKCIKGHLKGKIVILATHQLQFLQSCEKILVLDKGSQIIFGSYSEIVSQGYNLEDINMNNKCSSDNREQSIETENFNCEQINERSIQAEQNNDQILSTQSLSEEGIELEIQSQNYLKPQDGPESQAKIHIGFGTYFNYYSQYLGWPQILYFVLILSVASCFRLAPSYILSHWSNLDSDEQNEGSYYLAFCLIIPSQIIICLIQGSSIITLLVLGNQKLFNKALQTLVLAQPSYFDKTQSGHILTLFSKDFAILDGLIIPQMICASQGFFYSVIGLIVVTIILPYLAIPFALVLFVFIFLINFIRVPFREAQRLETMHRGPLHQNIINTIQGITSIRSKGSLPYFRDKLVESLELGTNASFTDRMMSRWLNNALDYTIVVFTSVTICLGIGLKGKIEVALLSYMMQVVIEITVQFSFQMRGFAEADNSILSAQRVFQFCETKREDALVKQNDQSLKHGWPSSPSIEFHNANLRYDPGQPLSLQNVSFRIEAGTRVGIVGRTGAGKSSILQALLRLVEIEDDGQILIDGVDTKTIGLHLLRQNVGYIPQTPFLMEGTIKQNLDPTGERSAEEIIEALERVQLWDYIGALPLKLDTNLQNFNQIFSVGQQQLFCLARALLQNCKILIIDEATANVDYETDAKIQSQLREGFVGCTLMVVAHRLQTVIDCDKILVMDGGRRAEFEHPFRLLAKEEEEGGDRGVTGETLFAEMVKATGKESELTLFEEAKRSFQKRKRGLN